MIIDCHGHYTTAPDALGRYRDRQKAELEQDPLHRHVKGEIHITDDQIRESLDANKALKERLEAIRLQTGPLMNLGNVKEKSVPKMTLAAPPRAGGAISTRTFIPHRCHASIGVLGAVSVATACMLPGSTAHALAQVPGGTEKLVSVEHPSGETSVMMNVRMEDGTLKVSRAAVLRTARKLFEGRVFPRSAG